MESHSLGLICRIFGYKDYVKSSARDHGDNRGQDRLNWTTTGDNTSLRFKDKVTFAEMILDEPLSGAAFAEKFTTSKNRKTNEQNARYQTWLQTITCEGKIDLITATEDDGSAESSDNGQTTGDDGGTEKGAG